jgi:hypothetical protein
MLPGDIVYVPAPTCGNCRHFEPGRHEGRWGWYDGSCVRFPKTESKDIGQRCGEFSSPLATMLTAPEAMPAALDVIQMASHEADDPLGPWTPIKNGTATKRYICTRLDK